MTTSKANSRFHVIILADNGETSFVVGGAIVEAVSKSEAKRKALDALWDDRLDSAGCSAIYIVNKLQGDAHEHEAAAREESSRTAALLALVEKWEQDAKEREWLGTAHAEIYRSCAAQLRIALAAKAGGSEEESNDE